MVAIAKARGLTADELADRLVPDLGLSERGSMVFDYGSRRFTLGFDADLKPFVRGPGDEPLAELPKPAKSDDESLANAALEDWKELKARARKVTSEQVRRLELAMAARRRFSLEHFETFFSRHPFMQHLARRIVWAVYGEEVQPVRLAEDGSYANARDEVLELAPQSRIGVVHPLDLDRKAAVVWADILASYEIIQPFPQLSRETFTDRSALAQLAGKKIPTTRILGLRRAGWTEGPTGDGGTVSTYSRDMGSDRHAVIAFDPGIYLGDPTIEPEQTLTVTLPDDADAVVFSEVVRDLTQLSRV
jgi:hypothetical protein